MAHYNKKRPVYKAKTEVYKKSGWMKFKEKIVLGWSNVKRFFAKIAFKINEKGQQKLTVMIVPHSEKKIFNLQISNYIMFFALVIFTVTIVTSVVAISNNQQTYKQIVQLKEQNESKRQQIGEYVQSIGSLTGRFAMFKTDVKDMFKVMGPKKNIYDFTPIPLEYEISNKTRSKESVQLQQLEQELEVTKENIRRMGLFIADKKKLLRRLPSIYPLKAKARITSPFGYRIDPVYRWKQQFHRGIDMATVPGTPILAAADGFVETAGWSGGYGVMVRIKHRYGFTTRYAHMSKLGPSISASSKVSQGQVVGYVGSTGKSTGYHLHYEVIIGDQNVNPQPFVSMTP